MNDVKDAHHRSPFHIGMRTLKTAFTALLCALIYLPFGRNPTFACIGAIFGLGSDMGDSRLNGGNRVFGTIIGGVLGMALFRIYIIFYPDGKMHLMMLPLLFIGVVLLILSSQWVHWNGAVQPGGVMLCIILFNTPVETYISYSLNRIIDSAFGVILALLVNHLLPRSRCDKIKTWFLGLFGKRMIKEEPLPFDPAQEPPECA